MKNKGKKYKFPPFVEITDDCEQGYGAVARSVINENGEVTAIYMVSEGENYPVGNINTNTSEETAQTNPVEIGNYVSSVYVEQSGFGYQSDDKAFDNFGNQYSIVVDEDGSIITANIDSIAPDAVADGITATDQSNIIPNLATVPVALSSPPLIINNYIIVEDLPIITIRSETGTGAILNPILDKLPIEVIRSNESSIRETKFVKDCIT